MTSSKSNFSLQKSNNKQPFDAQQNKRLSYSFSQLNIFNLCRTNTYCFCSSLERISIDCRKTKTKVITLANKKDEDNPINLSKLEVITRSRHKARENVHARATIGFGFTSDWLKKWRENFKPIPE